jgi:hypothetical protein
MTSSCCSCHHAARTWPHWPPSPSDEAYLSSPHLETSPATTFRACSSPAQKPVKPQPAPATLGQESVHTTLSITHHRRKRPSTGPRTIHGPQRARSGGLFYCGPYHPISLWEKDQYERIQRLRLIVYHHNLHMWYRVVCIGGMGGIGVLLELLSRWHKRNIWFLHFIFFSFPFGDMANFLKNKQKFSFQISKMKHFKLKKENFNFSFQIFMTYFNPNLKIDFFQFFTFPMAIFFKFKNKKIQIKFQKYFFKIFHFKFSLWHKWTFLLARGCQI